MWLGPSPSGAPGSPALRPSWRALLGAAGAALPAAASLALCAFFIWRVRFEVGGETYFSLFDDALISMRFARHLVEGHGLVWNVGEPPVEGYTNLLWTLWMALLHLTGAPDSKISLLVRSSGALLVALNVLVVGAIARRLSAEAPRLALLAAWMAALSYPNVVWGVGGLEVPLVALAISWVVLQALRLGERPDRAPRLQLCLGVALGLLTRSDFLVPALVVAVFAVATAPPGRRRSAALAPAAAVVATLLAHTAFRLLYYGDPLPNSYYLKLLGAPLEARLARGLAAFGVTVLTSLFLPLAFAGAVWLAGRRPLPRAAPLLAAVFGAQCLYSIWVGGDAWEFLHYPNRYLAPALPLLLVLASAGLLALARGDRPARGRCTAFALSLVPALPLLEVALRWLSARVELVELGLPLDDRFWQAGRTAMAGSAALAALLLLWAVPALRVAAGGLPLGARLRTAAVAALAIATLLMMEGEQATRWARATGVPSRASASNVRLALAIRDATTPEARVAVVWAGAIPYFSRRPAVDLLGKSDRVIARGERRLGPLYPGHDKWDYAYSIGRLRPDVIAQLWRHGPEEIRALERWGYVRVHPQQGPTDLFVRADSTRVDVRALRRSIVRDHARPRRLRPALEP